MPTNAAAKGDDGTFACFPLNVTTKAPSEARKRTAELLTNWGLSEICDDVTLCLSELVTNPVMQGAAEVAVLLVAHGERRVLAAYVWDNAPGIPRLQEPSPISENGRGLKIVAALAKEWGHYSSVEGGKVVWARFHAGRGEYTSALGNHRPASWAQACLASEGLPAGPSPATS